MNSRVAVLNDIGTIRYIGPLQHKKSDVDDIWVGIEWDDP